MQASISDYDSFVFGIRVVLECGFLAIEVKVLGIHHTVVLVVCKQCQVEALGLYLNLYGFSKICF